jgi:phytoene/squalene synthetase
LQDCQADYRNLNRVYVPQDSFAAAGVDVEALGEARGSPALLACLHRLADRTELLLRQADAFPSLVADRRLGLEIAVIVRLAHHLTGVLMRRDPLSECVHVSKLGALGLTAQAVLQHGVRSLGLRAPARLPEVSGP